MEFDLSIVIVGRLGGDAYSRCAESVCVLLNEAIGMTSEVIVAPVTCSRMGNFSWPANVNVSELEPSSSVPEARMRAILRARGNRLLLIEDDCVLKNWELPRIFNLLSDGNAAIGATVLPGDYSHGWEWACYFHEYRVAMPSRNSDSASVHGAAVIYDRRALCRFLESDLPEARIVHEHGFHEVWVHQGLKRLGYRTVRVQNWRVQHWKFLPFGTQLSSAFHHGRGYSGLSREFLSERQRLLRAAAAPALVLIFLTRSFRASLEARLLIRYLQSLPWLWLLSVSWSLGEGLGYVFGPGGRLRQWR